MELESSNWLHNLVNTSKISLLYTTLKGLVLWYVNSVSGKKKEKAHWNFIRNVPLNFFLVFVGLF